MSFRGFSFSGRTSSTALALTALLLNGCLENGSINTPSAAGFATTVSNGASNAITINKVVRSNLNPDTTIELIGSSGQIAQFCPTVNDCQCRFDFIDGNGALAQRFQTPDYIEVNLARCQYTSVTSNAGYYDVSLVVTKTSAHSNSTRIFLTTLSPSLDPSVANNYVPANRFLCRDVISKASSAPDGTPGFYGANLQDPKAWVMGQAYNFYSTSLGADYGAHAVTVGQSVQETPGFECPPIPNDASFDPSIKTEVFSLDPVNFADYGGSATIDNTIFPNDDKVGIDANCATGKETKCEKFLVNRHDYYLARFQDGTFKQPVCTLHTPANFLNPTLKCDTSGITPPITLAKAAATSASSDVIGFAALPDSNQECPNTNGVHIPAGKKWAKLWRFRASLTQRTLQTATNVDKVGALVCTTRNAECNTGIQNANGAGAGTIDTNCWYDSTNSSFPRPTGGARVGTQQMQISSTGGSFGNCSTAGTIGDNWTPTTGAYQGAGTVCNASTTAGAAQGSFCCGDNGIAGFSATAANYTPGGDWCTPSLRGQMNAGGLGGLAQDVWLISDQKRGCIEADTDASGKLMINSIIGADPYTYSSININTGSLFDYLYVVSPASIRIEDMTDPNSFNARKFTPFRKDRDDNTINYGISLGSENTATPLERLVKFPICVLQDAK